MNNASCVRWRKEVRAKPERTYTWAHWQKKKKQKHEKFNSLFGEITVDSRGNWFIYGKTGILPRRDLFVSL